MTDPTNDDRTDDDGIAAEDLGYGGGSTTGTPNPGLATSGAGSTNLSPGAGTSARDAVPTGTGMDVTEASERPQDELPEGAQTPETRTTNNTSGGPVEE